MHLNLNLKFCSATILLRYHVIPTMQVEWWELCQEHLEVDIPSEDANDPSKISAAFAIAISPLLKQFMLDFGVTVEDNRF